MNMNMFQNADAYGISSLTWFLLVPQKPSFEVTAGFRLTETRIGAGAGASLLLLNMARCDVVMCLGDQLGLLVNSKDGSNDSANLELEKWVKWI